MGFGNRIICAVSETIRTQAFPREERRALSTLLATRFVGDAALEAKIEHREEQGTTWMDVDSFPSTQDVSVTTKSCEVSKPQYRFRLSAHGSDPLGYVELILLKPAWEPRA